MSFWDRFFQGNINWTFHTTMTCDLRYAIELAYLQQRKNVGTDILSESELSQTAVFYFDNHRNRGLTFCSGGKNLNVSRYRAIAFPVNSMNADSNPPTYHAKISLAEYEENGEIGYRLAVFSKNHEYNDSCVESSIMFRIKITDYPTESGKALCSYITDICEYTKKSEGKDWIKKNLNEEVLTRLSKATLVSEFEEENYPELHFGGVHKNAWKSENLGNLGSRMKLNEVENDSIVLTPPEFIRGTSAEKFFMEKHILYDLKDGAKPYSSSHIKLYLLHRRENGFDKYELWTGSANATQRGIGWNFETNTNCSFASIECLVKFTLSKEKFEIIREGILRKYALFNDFSKPGSLENYEDDFGAWMVNHAKVESIIYCDERGNQINGMSFSENQKRAKSMIVQVRLDTKPEPGMFKSNMCWRPLEYTELAACVFSQTEEVSLVYEFSRFNKPQHALCFGSSQAVLWLDDNLLSDVPSAEEEKKMDKRVTDILLSKECNCLNGDDDKDIGWFMKIARQCMEEFKEK